MRSNINTGAKPQCKPASLVQALSGFSGRCRPADLRVPIASLAVSGSAAAGTKCSRRILKRSLQGRLVPVAATGAAAPASHAPHSLVLDVGSGKQIILETGEIGRQANGSIVATMGETVLYTTACCAGSPSGDGTFLPLTVNYQERFSAVGRTPSGYIKRDGKTRESEVLVSRLVDRPLRPMFAEGWANETQVLQWVMSYDGVHDPLPLAITAASAALLVSDIPFDKAVAGMRVGWINGKPVVNPSVSEMSRSELDLVIAGTRDAVLMIEGYCSFLSEDQMMEAVEAGAAAIGSVCKQLEAWAKQPGVSKPKRYSELQKLPEGLQEAVDKFVSDELYDLYSKGVGTKEQRSANESATKDKLFATFLPPSTASAGASQAFEGASVSSIEDSDAGSTTSSLSGTAASSTVSSTRSGWVAPNGTTPTHSQLSIAYKNATSNILRRVVLETGRRVDGRGLTDIRPIRSRANLLPRTHGSALFTRGETQVIAVATLGSRDDALKADTMRSLASTTNSNGNGSNNTSPPSSENSLSNFYLHYFFPPSSVGEVGRVGAPGRRELGHGELAQRALTPAIPPQSSFPYVVRLESTVTESNGSSSMASVCGGTLAMLDAGVPMVAPVAGIAMGLILEEGTGRFAVLSDILGAEDALGDMDFKVAGAAGARSGITAFQMDIKVEGITPDIMRKALAQAAQGRAHILAEMEKCDPAPRRALSPYTPHIIRRQIDPSNRPQVIGSGGRTIRQIMEASGALSIDITDDGTLEIIAPSEAQAAKALDYVEMITDTPALGRVFRGVRVTSLKAFGVFVELSPGRDGMVHLSELDTGFVAEPSAVVKVGDLIDVMVLNTSSDKISLSRKAVQMQDSGVKVTPTASGASSAGAGAAGAGAGAQQQAGRAGSFGGGGGRGGGQQGQGAVRRTPRQ